MQKVCEPENSLLEKCKNGDKNAFRELFFLYRSYAYNLIYKITGPNGDHEDLVQDAFFQMYLSLRAFQGKSSFKTWFHRIIIHVCTRQWRYQNTEKRISPKDTVNYDILEYAISSKEKPFDKSFELKDTIQKAMSTLDIKLRIPLVLHIFGDLNLSEVSAIVDVPEGTVKSRLFTARKKIREFFDRNQ